MENKTLSLVIGTKELRKAVDLAGSAVPNNAIVMAAENLLFKVTEDKMVFVTGTDTNTTISTVTKCISADIMGGDSFMISYKFLSELLRELPDMPLVIDYGVEEVPKNRPTEIQLYKYRAEIFAQDLGLYKVPCENPDDFPVAKFESAKKFKMDVQQFRHGLRHTKDFYKVALETRPAMSGVRVDCTQDMILMVAMQNTRGSLFMTKEKTQEMCVFTIPDKMVNFLFSNIKEQATGQVVFQLSDSAVKAKFGSFTILASLYNGDFAPYERLNSIEMSNETMINLDDWRAGIKRALIFSNENKEVSHSFSGGKIHLKSADTRYDTESDQYIDVSEDVKFEITLNGKDIISGTSSANHAATLKTIPGDTVMFVYPQKHEGESLTYFFSAYRP